MNHFDSAAERQTTGRSVAFIHSTLSHRPHRQLLYTPQSHTLILFPRSHLTTFSSKQQVISRKVHIAHHQHPHHLPKTMASLFARTGLLDVWHKEADSFTSQLFMTQSPVTFLGVLIGIFLTIKRTEQLMKHEKQPDFVKPALLILYGLNFGLNGAGILLALTATDAGRDCFRCVNRNQLDIMTISMRYLGYAYLVTVVFEYWMQVLEALQKNSNSTPRHLRDMLWIITNFAAFNFTPVGQFAFCPLAHCVIRTMKYAVGVLSSASPELRLDNKKWSARTTKFEVLGWAAIALQQIYVYSALNCDYSWINLTAATVAALQSVSIALKM